MDDLPHKADDVQVSFSRVLCTMAEGLGYDVQDGLDRCRISRSQLKDKSTHISFQQQQDFVSTLVQQVDEPGFGLLIGQNISIIDWGILGYAFISSPNLRKGLDTFCTYQRLNGPMVNIYFKEDCNYGELGAVEAYPLGDLHIFAFEEWLAETLSIFNRLDIEQLELTEVCLTYPEPAHADMYRALSSCPVKFGQEKNSVRFPASVLQVPFNMADVSVAELCLQQCAKVLNHLSEEDPVVDAVRRVLLTNPGVTPTLALVADQLHMSSRTLRRRLHDAGTSYKDILSGVRLGLAAEYLRSSRMAPKQIAYLLGYSGVTSFHRAFKNQYEQTPADYRAGASEEQVATL
jgi:AraC-like DNA-binding protein